MVVRVRSATIPTPAELTTLTQTVAVAVQQEAVDSDDAAQGITEPPVITSYLSIGTQALPAARTGVGYTTQVMASGGTAPFTWSLAAGALPPGLGLSAAGAISGTPSADGTFTFTLQVADAAAPVQTATRTMALTVSTPGVASLAFVTQPSNTLVGAAITPAVSVRAVDTTGAVVSGIPVTLSLIGPGALSGVLTRQTGAPGVSVFTGLSISTLSTGLTLQATAPGFAGGATSIPFSTTIPDLIVSAIVHTPINPTPTDPVVTTAIVQNIGTGPSSTSFLMLQLPGETSGAEETLMGVPPLAPGASFAVQRTVPPSAAGPYVVNAFADFVGAVAESNETNNTAFHGYTVAFTELMVINTADSGPGSLRQALLDANVAPDTTTIHFNIPGAGPYTIQPQTPLPTVTSPIVLDATTQPSFAGTPIVELSGVLAGASAVGLVLEGGNSTVRGLVINRWGLSGVALNSLSNVGNNVLAGNYIGTDVNGSGGAPSTLEQTTNTYTHNPTANRVGVLVSSPNNRIGGTTLADRNLIAGNSEWGLAISVQTAADGVTVLGTGAGTIVQGNYFGTDATGTLAKPNGAVRTNNGVPNALSTGSILVQVPNVTIGGVTAGAGNVISANAIGIVAGPRFTAGTFTLISDGSSLIVQGNRIGTNAAGTAALPFNTDLTVLASASRGTGIQISSPSAVIGGSATGAANVISGNASYGIHATATGGSGGVLVSSASNLTVQGNRIGTNLAGTAAIPGSGAIAGINLHAPDAHIGGTAAGAGNIISGNGGNGIQLASFAIPPIVVTGANALIESNWIGLSNSGTAAVPNGLNGISVNAAASVVIRANIISGNGTNGIAMAVSSTTLGAIRGNWIGLASNGTSAVGNGAAGVFITNSASGNTVGGTNPGDGNVISGNINGISIDSNASTNIVRGNFIGTTVSGAAALPNAQVGIVFNTGATNNVIGGTTAAARNVISGNGFRGIALAAGTGAGNQITGNFVGTNAAGNAAIPNGQTGIVINNSSTVVGGTTPGAGNVISGNGDLSTIQAGFGIQISGGASNVVQGNFIGTNATGTAALGNKSRGIDISNSTNNTIGGTTAAARNIISGNGTAGGGAGVGVFGANNTIQGNYIGTDVTGVFPIPNTFGGVLVRGANTVVGGTAPGAGNRIAFNTNAAGVSVLDNGANSPILGNRIFSNAGLGIDLAVGVATNGVTVNDAGDGDVGPNDLQNFPVITSATTTTASGTLNSTPNTTFTIQLFVSVTCDPSGFGEGDTPIAIFNVTTDGTGLGNFAQGGLALDNGQIITATATNPGGSTSEFSACAAVGGGILSGTLLDASGDVPAQFLADLVRASVNVQGGNVTLSVRFAPTFGGDTAAQFVLDTDDNPATGNQGTNSLCSADNGVIGAEYLVDLGPGSLATVLYGGDGTQAAILPFVGPGCNSYGAPALTASGTVTDIFDDDFMLIGMDVTFPLSMIGNDDGHLRFKILSYNHVSGNTFTAVLDQASEIGQAAGQVQ